MHAVYGAEKIKIVPGSGGPFTITGQEESLGMHPGSGKKQRGKKNAALGDATNAPAKTKNMGRTLEKEGKGPGFRASFSQICRPGATTRHHYPGMTESNFLDGGGGDLHHDNKCQRTRSLSSVLPGRNVCSTRKARSRGKLSSGLGGWTTRRGREETGGQKKKGGRGGVPGGNGLARRFVSLGQEKSQREKGIRGKNGINERSLPHEQ